MRNPTITERLRGEAHPAAKLTESDVRAIREKYREGWSCMAIGKAFGVSRHTVKLAATGVTWKHVE